MESERTQAPTAGSIVLQQCSSALDKLHARIVHRFRRPEVKERVHRYLAGLLSQVERRNAQVGVFLAYSCGKGMVFVDRALWLPEEWANDPARGEEGGQARVDRSRRFRMGGSGKLSVRWARD